MFRIPVRKKKIRLLSAFAVCIILLSIFLRSCAPSEPITENKESEESEQRNPLTVILDPGHGGEDPGTVGTNGVYEKDLNLIIAETIGEMLSEKGVNVIYTRTDDRLLYTEEENVKGIRKISDLKNRVKMAEEYPGALFVSIHQNANAQPSCSGTEVYYSPDSAEDEKLAEAILNRVKADLQSDSRRKAKAGEGIYLLEHIPNVSVLIECGFLSNSEECEKLCEKEYQKQLCFSIFCAIIEYATPQNTETDG